MSPAAWTSVGSITVALIAGVFGVIQLVLKRQQPADDTPGPTKAEAYQLAGDLTPAVIQLSRQVAALEQADRDKGRAMEGITEELARLRATVAVVIPAARALVAWIDSGAAPPPPVVTDELRELLAEKP